MSLGSELTPELLCEVLPTSKQMFAFLMKRQGWLAKHGCKMQNEYVYYLAEKVPATFQSDDLSVEECKQLVQELDGQHYRLLNILLPKLKKKILTDLFRSCGKQRIKAYLAAKLSKIEFIDLTCLKSRNPELLQIYSATCDENALVNLVRKIREMKVDSLDEERKREAFKAMLKYCPIAHRRHVEEALFFIEKKENTELVQSTEYQSVTPSIHSCKYFRSKIF